MLYQFYWVTRIATASAVLFTMIPPRCVVRTTRHALQDAPFPPPSPHRDLRAALSAPCSPRRALGKVLYIALAVYGSPRSPRSLRSPRSALHHSAKCQKIRLNNLLLVSLNIVILDVFRVRGDQKNPNPSRNVFCVESALFGEFYLDSKSKISNRRNLMK